MCVYFKLVFLHPSMALLFMQSSPFKQVGHSVLINSGKETSEQKKQIRIFFTLVSKSLKPLGEHWDHWTWPEWVGARALKRDSPSEEQRIHCSGQRRGGKGGKKTHSESDKSRALGSRKDRAGQLQVPSVAQKWCWARKGHAAWGEGYVSDDQRGLKPTGQTGWWRFHLTAVWIDDSKDQNASPDHSPPTHPDTQWLSINTQSLEAFPEGGRKTLN